MNVKTKDTVLILAGKDKGKKGEVKSVNPTKNTVVVAGVNMVSKHQKPSQNKQGGIVQVEAPIHASNVAVVCTFLLYRPCTKKKCFRPCSKKWE